MKYSFLVLMALAVVLGAGCNKRDIRKSATLNLDFEIDANGDSARTFQMSSVMRATDNAAIAEIKEEIDRYEIRSIKYSIWELYGNDSCQFTGTLKVRKVGDAASEVYYSYNNFAFDVIERKIEIPFSDSDRKRIEDFLLVSDELEFVLEGTLTHQPLHFVMNVELNIDALAEK